ncbi:uncharacterized protein BX663DRAFT_504132 [Cokeromyces recurvatus]|uniref:uncharacterized protein n=1 Tax=Cokeromyces recurvatus TaxID=90255 RepID=UPI00221ED526|nr:uncharacterized protein BX663DRAFT_504132 [Cokeromyces recurvatus]KAI7904161.1 hypothetical protein BX663DRAFT_504132 [Cokeromyces recurvatus]
MRIHTHEQPFKCNFPGCFKAFSRSDNLSQHRKTHERRNHNNSRLSTNKLVEESFLHQQQNPHVVTHSNGNNNVHDSFTLAEFIRDNQYNNTTITATTATTANTNNTKQQHSLLAWQHPGDTSTESVGC